MFSMNTDNKNTSQDFHHSSLLSTTLQMMVEVLEASVVVAEAEEAPAVQGLST